MKNIKY